MLEAALLNLVPIILIIIIFCIIINNFSNDSSLDSVYQQSLARRDSVQHILYTIASLCKINI